MVPVSPPLPEFLRLSREGATGELWFRLRGRQIGVSLHQGGVMQVVGLPELIMLEGHRLTASVNTGDMLSDIGTAVAGGVPPDEAMDAAGWGLGRFLTRVAHDDDATAAWDEGVEPPKGAFPLPMPVLKSLAKGLSEARTPDMVQQHWRNKTVLVVRPSDMAKDLGNTRGLSPVAARALNLASGGEVLADLVERLIGGNPRRRTKTWWAIDLLLETGLLVFQEVSAAQVEIEDEFDESDVDLETKSDTADDPLAADPAVVRMHRQYRKLLKMRPLAALEIKVVNPEEGLKVDVVREAFRRAAKKYHPDKFTGEHASLRRAAALCFQVLGEYKSLMEEPRHLAMELERIAQERKGRAHVKEDDRVKAKVLYNKGNSFFRNRAYGAARDAFAESVILDPDFKMARARHTHCRAVLKEVPYEKAYMTLNEIEADNVGEKIELLFLTAWLLKLLGREQDAIKQYKAILERNPEHREALREVRLWEKRAPERSSTSRRGGKATKDAKEDTASSGFFRSIRKRRGS